MAVTWWMPGVVIAGSTVSLRVACHLPWGPRLVVRRERIHYRALADQPGGMSQSVKSAPSQSPCGHLHGLMLHR